jgi:hypothetical protein
MGNQQTKPTIMVGFPMLLFPMGYDAFGIAILIFQLFSMTLLTLYKHGFNYCIIVSNGGNRDLLSLYFCIT